jgi:hypothetical protein
MVAVVRISMAQSAILKHLKVDVAGQFLEILDLGRMLTVCSQNGYCGSTADHCLPANGCQLGCTSSDVPTFVSVVAVPTQSTPPGRCGKDFGGATCDPKEGYGGCCSEYG